MNNPDNSVADAVLLHWLAFFTVLVFAFWVLWHNDLIQNVIRTDPTRLSVVIMLIFAGGTMHCAFRSACLSARLREITAIIARPDALQTTTDASRTVRFDGAPLPDSPLTDYLTDATRCSPQREAQLKDINAVLVERVTGSHETGWFFAQLLIKLGLLGTVAGFIIMLASIHETVSYDASHVPELFSGMTGGMRVALNTTLVGLVGTILLSFQYLMIDRGADRLLSIATHFATTRLVGSAADAGGKGNLQGDT